MSSRWIDYYNSTGNALLKSFLGSTISKVSQCRVLPSGVAGGDMGGQLFPENNRKMQKKAKI